MVILAARDSQTRKGTANVVDLLLRANALGLKPQSLQNFKDAEALQRQALLADPLNATATLGLADTLLLQAFNFGGVLKEDLREKLISEGGALAMKAKTMDPDNPRSTARWLCMHGSRATLHQHCATKSSASHSIPAIRAPTTTLPSSTTILPNLSRRSNC